MDNLLLISRMAHMIRVVALKHRKHEQKQHAAKNESMSSSDEEKDDEEDEEDDVSIDLEECAAVANVVGEFSVEE